MNNTAWKYSINFINTLTDDKKFKAYDMLKYVRRTHKDVHPSTLFWHRVILSRLGFLEQTHQKGIWIKLQSFPYDVGKARAEVVAFSDYQWQRWFIPPGWKKLKKVR